ncbi:hypothetical protein [Sphingobacterium faecale]|uniref:Uncharacterized protein n=1 Tax=Sphingobacterium faecale TaxID=2803775 RepID=A0ABS1R294_9SPHI|nr:hypothetical protein [Sphingobacterium faecale]MBL1408768.1 hypothetical protein [Sphingobacterium faecale]
MMSVSKLPPFVRDSVVLTVLDKEKLARMESLPSEDEVDAIRRLPEILELTNAFIGDESSRYTHLQLKAKEYLDSDDVMMAWKVLLL